MRLHFEFKSKTVKRNSSSKTTAITIYLKTILVKKKIKKLNAGEVTHLNISKKLNLNLILPVH